MSKIPIVLATRNQGKIREITDLLSGYDIDIKSLNDFGPIPEVDEDGDTFEDNAYIKAHFTARVLGLPAIADDSGLVVDVLDGAPGVYSARYAGEEANDEENNRKLLNEMANKANRKARFETALIIAVPRGPALTYIGKVEGEITGSPQGDNGFGYDPLFYYPPMSKTFAQMTGEEKNSISHRGKAVKELAGEFDKVLIWLKNRMAEEPYGADECYNPAHSHE
ncbi:MAG: XTP/dITP diphosphatase [Desulfobacteraceae bacterium]|jgi:XTP/dITP diphosphohydrolase